MHSEEKYKLLPASDGELAEESATNEPTKATYSRVHYCVVATQSLVIVFLLAGWLASLQWHPRPPNCQVVYSPAQDAIVYEAIRWHEDVWRPNPYKGEPSDEVDQAWGDLYNGFGISQIPKSQARLLVNRTLSIPTNPDYHIIQLSVFHQLHCLNTIRKALRMDHYADPVTGDLGNIPKDNINVHLGHCMDSIRQGLMCASDISPIVWKWSDEKGRAYIDMDVVHSCRNYDMIVEWAKVNKYSGHFDLSLHLEE